MSEQIEINTFDDLINFIETQNASTKDIQNIISKTVGVYVFLNSDNDKTQLIKDLKTYWSKYKNKPLAERPMFLCDVIK